MLTDLRIWKMVVDTERELAISRAARLGPMGALPHRSAPRTRMPRVARAPRRLAPVLRLMGLM